MLNLPRAVNRGGAGNARATSCFAGAGDGLQSKLQRLHEGRPDSFLSLAELAREDPAGRGRAVDGVATAAALLGQCGTLLGDDARERSRAALFFLSTLCSPPEPGAAQRLSERQHAALLGYAAEARSACAQHHVVRRCVVATMDELACGRTAKIRSRDSITVETLHLLAHLSRRGNGAQDARDAVAAYDVEPFLVAVRTQACDGTLPRDWKASLLQGCDEVEQCYHVCRRDANVVCDTYARQALKRPFLALAVEARSKLHAFATTKGRVELGAEKAAAEASKALRDLVKEVREDTKEEIASDADQKAKASELRSAGKRGAAFDVEKERSMRRHARARAAACHGGAAAATAALRRFSQLNKGRMAHGALDEARRDVREAACEVYAVLQCLGDFGDGEDAAQAGPLLLTMLEDGASRSISPRSRIQNVSCVWFALEALLTGEVSSEPRLRLIDALRGQSSRVADLAAASLVGDGGPRDLALHDEARSSLRVVAALVPPGSDQLKAPTALRIAIACEAVAQSQSELVGLAIRVLLVVAQRVSGQTRDLLERRADALDADAEEPYYKACGLLRTADDDKKLAEALVLLRDAAPEAGPKLAEAGVSSLLLDILRGDDGAAKKATMAIRTMEAVGAAAKASYACRILLAANGSVDAVRVASKYENVPGVAKAVIDGLASLFSDGEMDGEALDTADDVDEDGDPDMRRCVRETAVVVSAGRCARFVVQYAAKARQNALHFSGGVSDTKALGDEAQASGLRCLNALLATRDRRNMFADRGPPDTENRNELRRYRARRACHSAARRLLAKDLRGAAGTIGDFLERAQLNFNQPNDATDAALEAFRRCHPRDVWKGEIFRGVEVAAWLASKRGALGEDCLIQTVACCWDTRHILPQGCLEVFIRVAASGREGLERAAPALETLYGKEADKGQHAEALEGFSWTTGKKELGAIPCRVVVSVAASAHCLISTQVPWNGSKLYSRRRGRL